MPIDFTILEKSKKVRFTRNNLWVHFPPEIHSFFKEHKSEFSNYATILNDLNDWDDYWLSEDDMRQLLYFLVEIKASFLYDHPNYYKRFSQLKSYGIQKNEFDKFIEDFIVLLRIALDDGKLVLAVGE